MAEYDVQQIQVAARLGRAKSYVSERLSGKKPVDSDLMDAVAELAGIDTNQLLDEINRRMSASIAPRDPDPDEDDVAPEVTARRIAQSVKGVKKRPTGPASQQRHQSATGA